MVTVGVAVNVGEFVGEAVCVRVTVGVGVGKLTETWGIEEIGFTSSDTGFIYTPKTAVPADGCAVAPGPPPVFAP